MGQLHEHGHVHEHRGGHASMWSAANGRRPVHPIGRRQFLTDLGRDTFAIAVLGGFVAACGGDDDTGGDDSPATSAGEPASESTTSGAATSTPGEGIDATNDPSNDPTAAGVSLRWAQAQLGSVSAYVLVRGNDAAVVDTGSSGSADLIGEALATLGATFDDVRHVVLTHSHPDHIGSLPAVLDRASGAAAYAGTLDIPNISAPIDVTAVGGGDDVFGLEVIDTPGHTPGSISVFDPGIGLLVAGDALNGTADGTGLTGPNPAFTPDMATANASVLELAELAPTAIAMGHGQPVESGADALLTSLASGL